MDEKDKKKSPGGNSENGQAAHPEEALEEHKKKKKKEDVEGLKAALADKEKELDEKGTSIQELKERLLYQQADFENFKRHASPDDYLRHQGVTDKSIWQMGEEVFSWLQGQELKSPGDLAPLVLNTTRMAEKNWGGLLRNFEEQTQQGFIRRGMKPVRLSDADIKYFQELSQKLREELAGKLYPRELLDEILRLKNEFNEKTLQEIY